MSTDYTIYERKEENGPAVSLEVIEHSSTFDLILYCRVIHRGRRVFDSTQILDSLSQEEFCDLIRSLAEVASYNVSSPNMFKLKSAISRL